LISAFHGGFHAFSADIEDPLLSRWIPAEGRVGRPGSDISLIAAFRSENCAITLNMVTTAGVPIELQFAPATQNFATTVLPVYRQCFHPQWSAEGWQKLVRSAAKELISGRELNSAAVARRT